MSGHSKWATIHRKKGLIDAERGKKFQKLAKEIQVAAKGTNGKEEDNPNLRLAIEKAKASNMPKSNIENAIKKAIEKGNTENYEAIRYEGYGPGASAFIVEALTDNKNRTASEVRSTFSKHGGNLGTSGSVAYAFSRKAVIEIDKPEDVDSLEMKAIDMGAVDFKETDDSLIIFTDSANLIDLKEGLIKEGVTNFYRSEISLVADDELELSDEDFDKAMELNDALEELDDVSDVYNNIG